MNLYSEKDHTEQEALEALIKFRRYLHAHPEESGNEKMTAEAIASKLRELKPDELIERVGGYGLIAVFDSGIQGPAVLFRADTDALPIRETNDFDYRSETPGISHKCGHDGHSTILLGFAGILAKQRPERGKVILLFQPSEENGEGAAAVIQDARFKALQPDLAIALHNIPGYPVNSVIVRKGAFTAAVKSLIIRFQGKTSHAGEPENGLNPAMAMAEVIRRSENLSNNDPVRRDFTLITPIHMEMGEIAYGISAGEGVLRLTIRTWTDEIMKTLSDNLIKEINDVSASYGIPLETEWTHEFHANENDPQLVDLVTNIAQHQGLKVIFRETPFKWGEDFGIFTQKIRGLMFCYGAGEHTPALHNPDYDFPDEILSGAIGLFSGICQELTK